MATHRILVTLADVLIAATLVACSSIGPPTVERDRIDYGSAIADSWKQQTLLNIVKLRYGDFPVFLEIAQVIAGYQIESSLGAGFNASNNSSFGTPAFFGGSAAAAGKYTDRPTLIYAPLTGNDFLKKLMTPIPPSAVLFMLQSGYAADLVLPLAVDSINGVSNESRRGMQRADPDFARLAQLLRELQLDEAVQVRIERPKGSDSESTMLVFPRRKDAETAARSAEIRRILGLKPGLQELDVRYGGYSGRDDEVSMMTRSMLQIMLELGAIVQVPASDIASGKAAPGATDVAPSEAQDPAMLHIASGDTAPADAYVAVRYGGRSFWIANTDIRSKYTFGSVMLLFSISETGIRGNAPVVTVPTN